ncbi:hypothetical protein GQX74_015520 [Glossina fuscipes]|uniref:Uncharacterized protein n=1 Tax=Glossina palpalis gambiensis TaxID=67801 RepID=A0A1B0BBL7_9MUSC|nr:hypothetical protein GQX74_015520 [Glossina fuscipes]
MLVWSLLVPKHKSSVLITHITMQTLAAPITQWTVTTLANIAWCRHYHFCMIDYHKPWYILKEWNMKEFKNDKSPSLPQ